MKRPLRVFGTHVLTVDIIGLVGGRNTKTTALIAGATFPFPLFRTFLPPPPLPFLRLPQATQLRANENGINNIDLQLIDRHQSISTKWHQSGAPFASVRSFPKNNDIGQAFVFSPPPPLPPFLLSP